MASDGYSLYRRFGKRWLDLVLSGGGLLVLSPLFVGLGATVRVLHGRPVLFKQLRTGLGGRSFYILKFRSMSDARDAEGKLLSDAERLTKFGRWLRRTSLDELPELWNVFKGEMSLVGPRPLLHEYMEHYTPEQHRRHSVPPGLTGWAAVNGRNTTTWEERFDLDLWYVDHQSLRLDLEILLKTVVIALSMKGVDPAGYDRMPEYRGVNGKAAQEEKLLPAESRAHAS